MVQIFDAQLEIPIFLIQKIPKRQFKTKYYLNILPAEGDKVMFQKKLRAPSYATRHDILGKLLCLSHDLRYISREVRHYFL